MNKRKKAKLITTIVCMALSLIALYAFSFVIEVGVAWRTTLVIVASGWLLSGIINLIEYIRK